MSRGSATGYAVTASFSTVFDINAGDGPGCTTFEISNIDPAAAAILIGKVTDKSGVQTIIAVAVGSSRDVRVGINGIAKVELKLTTGTGTAYAAPVAWGGEAP